MTRWCRFDCNKKVSNPRQQSLTGSQRSPFAHPQHTPHYAHVMYTVRAKPPRQSPRGPEAEWGQASEWTLDTRHRSRHRQRPSHTLHVTHRQQPATTRHTTSECTGANDGPTTTQAARRETATLAGPATGRKTDGLKPPPALPPHSGTLPPRRRTMSKPGELMSFESSTWSSSSSSTS